MQHMPNIELKLNIEHALKSVYGKKPISNSQLFSSYRTVFELAHVKDMITLKISAGYFVRIRRHCSSNVRLKTPKLRFKINLNNF